MVSLRIIQKISNIPFQVYRISNLQSSITPYNTVPKVSLHQMTRTYWIYNPSALHQYITTEINTRINSNGSLIFGTDGNYQKSINTNETRLTFAIAYFIISEGLSFNLAQNPIYKKIMELARNVSKTCITPNRNRISKELLDFIHKQNTKINLAMIKKKAEIFGFLFVVVVFLATGPCGVFEL